MRGSKPKRLKDQIPKIDPQAIEYVIYCRKSTDDSSGKQTQSISDQLKLCVKHAAEMKYTIMKKPEDFSDFEDTYQLTKEDNEIHMEDRRIYKETRDLFIVKEEKSAKDPYNRPKRSKLIDLVKKGRVKGILSYSSDRQTRNMLEWGELLDLVDQNLLVLKYVNFNFENSASGKMMLGFWFVFSTNYVNNLSETVTRGKKSWVERGKSQWSYKYGYYRDEETGYYMPNWDNHLLMKEAFRMKIYDNRSDEYIAKRLNNNGYERTYKKDKNKITYANPKRLTDIWTDAFYYGVFNSGGISSDQREQNPYYEPLITVEEYQILWDRYAKKSKELSPKEIKEELQELMPISRWKVLDCDWYAMSFTLPNKNTRFVPKLKELQKHDPSITLADIVKPKQMRYDAQNKASSMKWKGITCDLIDKILIDQFDTIVHDEKIYQAFIDWQSTEYDQYLDKSKKERNSIDSLIREREKTLEDYVRKNMGFKKDEQESQIYENEKTRLNNIISILREQRNNLDLSDRNQIYEFELFVSILQDAWWLYRDASYVQKAHLFDLFFLNITISKDLSLRLAVKPELADLFIQSNQTGWQYYEQMYAIVSKMDIRTIRSYIDFHITQMWGEINSLQKLSEKQRSLYGVTDIVSTKTI